jgi:hypothetical protein
MGRRRLAVAAACALLASLVAGCRAAAPTWTFPPAPTPSDELQVVLASTSIWVGPATLLVSLEDAANQPIALEGLELTARLVPVASAASDGAPVAGTVFRPLALGRELVRFDTTVSAAGRWRLDVEAKGGGRPRHGSAELTARDPGKVPAAGEPAPATTTPTAADVGGDLSRLTSDPIPHEQYYWLSVAAALEAEQPFALVIDSFGFRESQACGGALGVMHVLADRFPLVSVIHVEPFVTRWSDGVLTLDPPDGPARLAPWSEAWGLAGEGFGPTSVPWVFVVGADGRVRAVFQGIVGTEELATALGDVSTWTPSGGAGISPTAAP